MLADGAPLLSDGCEVVSSPDGGGTGAGALELDLAWTFVRGDKFHSFVIHILMFYQKNSGWFSITE